MIQQVQWGHSGFCACLLYGRSVTLIVDNEEGGVVEDVALNRHPLAAPLFWMLLVLSCFLTSFGQPAWIWWLGPIASFCGFALCFRALFALESPKQRFWYATFWFTIVTVVQLSWMTSHHYLYIYIVLVLFSFLLGTQFGLLSLVITPQRLARADGPLLAAGLWTLFEWLRLFFMSGYTWNPAGLAFTGSLYALQAASVFGIYGLSFWFALTNFCALRWWLFSKTPLSTVVMVSCLLLPYVYGAAHLHHHLQGMQTPSYLTAVLVQPNTPVEHEGAFSTPEKAMAYVLNQWRKAFAMLAPHREQSVDMIVFPEYFVPFGTYWPVYNYDLMRGCLASAFGKDCMLSLPKLKRPDAERIDTPHGPRWIVSNAFIAQTLANLFDASVVLGLQDEDNGPDGVHTYSSAYHFSPADGKRARYEKQVLLPMGEYIPCSLLRDLARHYGVVASFTPGSGAKVLNCSKTRFGISICYEETFGELMRQNRTQGAELLVNVTNDGWYPNSRLSYQHFDLARVRAVELGIPLVRAANTGVTGAIDSLGQVVAIIEEDGEAVINGPGVLKVDVPLYHYETPYSMMGDAFILSLSSLSLLLSASLHFIRSLR